MCIKGLEDPVQTQPDRNKSRGRGGVISVDAINGGGTARAQHSHRVGGNGASDGVATGVEGVQSVGEPAHEEGNPVCLALQSEGGGELHEGQQPARN